MPDEDPRAVAEIEAGGPAGQQRRSLLPDAEAGEVSPASAVIAPIVSQRERLAPYHAAPLSAAACPMVAMFHGCHVPWLPTRPMMIEFYKSSNQPD